MPKCFLVLKPDSKNTAHFVSAGGIKELTLTFYIDALKEGLWNILFNQSLRSDMKEGGFAALLMTRRLGKAEISANDLSGPCCLRHDGGYQELPREDLADKAELVGYHPCSEKLISNMFIRN